MGESAAANCVIDTPFAMSPWNACLTLHRVCPGSAAAVGGAREELMRGAGMVPDVVGPAYLMPTAATAK